MDNTIKLPWQEFDADALRFDDQVILITGAAGGIGSTLTKQLATRGATVIMLDKKQRHLEKLYDELCSENATEPVMLPTDLTQVNAENINALVHGLEQDFGRLDALVHNAAELGTLAPLDQYDLQQWNTVMQVNLHAPYLLTRELLPLLQNANNGRVLFTTTDSATRPSAFWGAYAIAYAGVEKQMSLWHEELENTTKLHFSCINPGAVRTAMRRLSHPGEKSEESPDPIEIIPAYLQALSVMDSKYRGKTLLVR
ncbi:MAG: SDR family NAD(P)-dependent oxidoreductase [Arenicellaceae bacterium]|nr:SDR family NAD(P)-dependent oxidoreductase [Arenicellaceae bacterium]